MDDLESNLQNYKLQLQQVEAALTTSPDNEELKKLKVDLEEVIRLTCDLIKAQILDEKNTEGRTEKTKEKPQLLLKRDWAIGDECLALYIPDGKYYEATVEAIEGDEVTVAFEGIKSTEVTTVEFLKELPENSGRSRKHPNSRLREYQKKRKMKKLQRFKQLEEERESEKNKWLAFSTKTTKKGVIKKSIFASPDNVNGRVGIGTCGVSGKGMTEFTSAEKWRKGV